MANHPRKAQTPGAPPPGRPRGSILMRVSPLLLVLLLNAACQDAAYPSGAFAQDPQRAMIPPPDRFLLHVADRLRAR